MSLVLVKPLLPVKAAPESLWNWKHKWEVISQKSKRAQHYLFCCRLNPFNRENIHTHTQQHLKTFKIKKRIHLKWEGELGQITALFQMGGTTWLSSPDRFQRNQGGFGFSSRRQEGCERERQVTGVKEPEGPQDTSWVTVTPVKHTSYNLSWKKKIPSDLMKMLENVWVAVWQYAKQPMSSC